MAKQNLLLLLAALILGTLPLAMSFGPTAEFSGADGQAQALIDSDHPDYHPWFDAIWEPPSGEIESLLFSLQAALGAGLLGYYLGVRRTQSRRRGNHGDARD